MEKFLYLYIFYYSLIASHINSHNNANTGLITNSNNNNAMLGLMNNITINNNNIIICFSLILQSSRESNPAQSRPVLPPITLTAVLYSCTKVLRNSYGLYTTNTTKGVAPSSSLFRAAILLYYVVLLYATICSIPRTITCNI